MRYGTSKIIQVWSFKFWAEGILDGKSIVPEGHHHLRDHGQADVAGVVA
jgi:hypothetical protein